MKNILTTVKLIGFVCIAISYFVSSIPLFLSGMVFRYGTRKLTGLNCMFHAKLVVLLLGIKISGDGEFKGNSSVGELIVANHLSYLDIMILASRRPCCFVTSIEMKHAPFLGQICEAGGCLYVERRSRSNLDNEISDITKALKSGLNVIVFPEATSTNGDELLRFKSPLFTAAIQAGVNVLPLAINYHAFDGQVLAKKNRDKLFWYGDMEFGNHFFNVLGIREIIVSLSLCERISANTCLGPKELAQASQLAVSKVFRPVIA